jgi:TRAP-type mannitol/chloroaromatic compound transport system substrate-binding protein
MSKTKSTHIAAPAEKRIRASRRTVLASLAGTATAAIALPTVAKSQGAALKFQSIWPANSILQEFAQDYVDIVNATAGGRIRLELLPPGAVVRRGGELQDAVSSGALDGAHGVASNQYEKNKAYSLFTTPPAFGWNTTQMLGWMRHGGGQELYDELVQKISGKNVYGRLAGPMPTQPLGWFKKPITSPADLKGLKFRTAGLSVDVFRVLGMEPVIIPGAETAAALASGRIDGAEYLNPTIDRQNGLSKAAPIYMIQGYHQCCECFEIIYNKAKIDSLGADVKRILDMAADSASTSMLYKQMVYYPRDMQALKTVDKITVIKTPDSVLEAQLAAWDKVITDVSASDPFFKRVIDSQRARTKSVVGFEMEWEVPRERAFRYFNRT